MEKALRQSDAALLKAAGGRMTAKQPQEESELPPASWWGRLKLPKLTLALSAFIMSMTVTLFNVYYALRGPEIVLLEKADVLLYRDGEGSSSTLMAAVKISMVNASGDYGDVMLDTQLTTPDGARFGWQGQVTPVLFADPAIANSKCPVDSRCMTFNGLTLIELPDEIPDLPAGSARQRHFTFAIASSNCSGSRTACARYGDFDKALATISRKPFDITVRFHFHADGRRTLRCQDTAVSRAYLEKTGWSSIQCSKVTVKGGGWL